MSLKLASVFSDNSVFQRNREIAVFGWADKGSTVKVSLLFKNDKGEEESVSAETVCGAPDTKKLRDVKGHADGSGENWLVYLPALKENRNCRLVVTDGSETKELKNIAIGEVWLLGGQSNMEFELQNCTTGKEHLANDNPDVRFYYTQKKGYIDKDFLDSEEKMAWSMFGPESAKCWSAAGYIFGKKLSEELGVTVGLIGCNWGGTSASVWMSRKALSEDAATNTYVEEYEKVIAGKTTEEQAAEYDAYLKEADVWNQGYGKLWEEKPGLDWAEAEKKLGKNPWPGPLNCYNPFRPEGLYECMIKRVAPYSIAGFTFYQGESDDHKPGTYYKLFKRMIGEWRDTWDDESLPFIFVQLPGHRYESDPDYKHWCIIREAQQRVSEDVDNTGMAVIIDAGEFNDIHPKDKEPVGERMCRIALEKVYGRMSADEAEAPEPESISFENGVADIRMRFTGDSLVIRAHGMDKSIHGFELAGEDREFKPAKAVLSTSGKELYVNSPEVAEPKYVRYLWTNYPETVSLYSAYGVPVRPFRTDSDDGADAVHETKIQQVMEL